MFTKNRFFGLSMFFWFKRPSNAIFLLSESKKMAALAKYGHLE